MGVAMSTTIIFAVLVGCWLIAFTGGYITGRRSRLSKHEHIWDAWENSKIDYQDGRSVSAQRRYCLSCGFKEVRKVCP